MTDKANPPREDLAASSAACGPSTRAGRRPYASPTLRRYGAIRNLTSGGLGSTREVGNMGAKKFP